MPYDEPHFGALSFLPRKGVVALEKDAFSRFHPAVNFLFFLGAIGFGVVIQHPAYLIAGILGGLLYNLLLNGRKGLRNLLMVLPLFLLISGINPLFNTSGERVLFHVFGRPYTLEALLSGMTLGGIFVIMTVWFGCYNRVLTSDKFTALLGNLIPALSLLLVMILRMIPNFAKKARQIQDARSAIGRGPVGTSSRRRRIRDSVTILSAMTDWALEGGIVTADSMRARGYGNPGRTSFRLYRMTVRDWVCLAVELCLAGVVVAAMAVGETRAELLPTFQIAPLGPGIVAYSVYLLIPSVLHFREMIQWHILRSRI